MAPVPPTHGLRSILAPHASPSSSASGLSTPDEDEDEYGEYMPPPVTPRMPSSRQLTRALIGLIELMQRSCSNKLLQALNMTQALHESSTFPLPIADSVADDEAITTTTRSPTSTTHPSTSTNTLPPQQRLLLEAASSAGAQYNHDRTEQLIKNVTRHIAHTLTLSTTNCTGEVDLCMRSLRQLGTAGNATATSSSSSSSSFDIAAGDLDDISAADEQFYYRGGSNGRSDRLTEQVVTNSIIQVVVLVIVITILLILTGKMLMDLGSRTGYAAHGGGAGRV